MRVANYDDAFFSFFSELYLDRLDREVLAQIICNVIKGVELLEWAHLLK